MFRLMKLLAYGLFGYALYEFFRGMSESGGGGGQAGGQSLGQGPGRPMRQMASGGGGSMVGSSMGGSQLGGQTNPMGAISGAGVGTDVATKEADGGSVRRKVGRGVIK